MNVGTREIVHEDFPPVAWYPNKYDKGVDGEEVRKDPVKAYEGKTAPVKVTLEDLLTKELGGPEDNPHLTCYMGVDLDTGEFRGLPRLLKNCEMRPGVGLDPVRPYANYIIVDIDNLGHTPWKSQDQIEAALDFLLAIPGVAGRWTMFYSTQHGYRLLYALRKAVPLLDYAPCADGILRALIEAGVDEQTVDTSGSEWTRLFKAPVPSEDLVYELRDQFIHPDEIEKVHLSHKQTGVHAKGLVLGRVGDRDRPSRGVGLEELENHDSSMTVIGRKVKARMRGGFSFNYLYGTAVPPKGERDETLLRGVGETVSRTVDMPEVTPETIYTLWERVVEQMEDEPGTDWFDVLWEKVVRFWNMDLARLEENAKVVRESRKHVEEQREGLSEAYIRAHPNSSVRGLTDEDDRLEWIKCHSIVSAGNRYHFLDPETGTYNTTGMPSDIAKSRPGRKQEPYGDAFPDTYYNKEGQEKKLSWDLIKTERLVRANRTEVHSFVDGKRCMTIETINGETVALSRNAGRIPYPAKESKGVDTWLRLLAGEKYDDLCKWLAYSLAIEDGPICALAMVGAKGTGKSLLVSQIGKALGGRCDVRQYLSGEHRFTDGMDHSGVLAVEETIVKVRGVDPAAIFRNIISHEPLRLEGKGIPAKEVSYIYYRLILTSNNEGTLKALVSKGKSSRGDRRASASRILVIRPEEDAEDYLIGRVDIDKWVRNDTIIKHINFLYQNRDAWEPGSRFLVEGSPDAKLEQLCWADSETTVKISEAIMRSIWATRVIPKGEPSKLLYNEHGVHYTTEGKIGFQAGTIHTQVRGVRYAASLEHVQSVLDDLAVGISQDAIEERLYFDQDGGSVRGKAEMLPERLTFCDPSMLIKMANHFGNQQVPYVIGLYMEVI